MLKILVTGASGFVGSHIVETLLEENYHVICVVRKMSNLRWIKNLPIDYRYGDLNNIEFLEEIVKDVDAVVHCAGVLRATSKEEYFKVNVENTRNLCLAILNNNRKLQKFIFISSQAAMGPSNTKNFKKINDIETPISDYGLSKFIAESEIRKLFLGKIPYTILRPAVIYGPRDKDVYIFFKLINRHLRPFTITKKFLQLVYVKDVAKVTFVCLQNKKSDNNIYYLANPQSYTWYDVGRIISYVANVNTIPLPIPDFVFKFVGFMAGAISIVTKKSFILNNQKVSEILQKYWIAETKPAENDLNIKFTCLEVASKVTYNWYLINNFF
ncbi:MAG: SDR family NAD(P)-dependent oxidoreductase [Endomicrobium sp.]|jgi:nucleoside-diphosphate-sugar epimerase|nr:SDR family NAD(P)-dependent oxidoreductase [Endomicrobium sp.]